MFLERDGTPIGGQVPMEVRYSGGGNYSTVAADVGALVRAFVNNVRQSVVPTHCETLPLPGNGFVELRYEYGSMMVDVYLPPADDQGGPFYGGILINPHVITGDQAAYLSLAGNPTPWRVPEGVKSFGAMPGRPAVPGTGDAATEWLVVQISRDLPLTGNPLATGAVRMFRIDAPLFGPFCEVAEPGRYAASTIDGSAFFLCGRQMDHVPPMPGGLPSLTRSSEAGGGPSPSRIRTVGMQPASFTDAHSAEGIIIFALVNQLWALNTRERTPSTPAPWRLLAEATMPRSYPADYLPNEFGAVFTVTTGAATTITCSGTNASGPCSGWTVTITPGDVVPTLSGTITLVDSGFMASAPHEQTVVFNGSFSRPEPAWQVDPWEFYYVDSSDEPTTPGTKMTLTRHVAYTALGVSEAHTLDVHVLGPIPAAVPDPILAGLMPRRGSRYERTFIESGSTSTEFVAFSFRLKGSMRAQRWVNSAASTVEPTAAAVGRINGGYVFDVSSVNFPSEALWLSITDFISYYTNVYSLRASYPIDFSGNPGSADARISYVYDYPGEVIGASWLDGLARYRRWGDLYVNTREIHGRVGQVSGIHADEVFVGSPAFATARYFPREFDVPANRLQFPGVTPFPIDDPISPAVWDEAPFSGSYVGETELDRWHAPWAGTFEVFDGEVLSRYPKRAAVFAPTEHLSVSDTYAQSLLGVSFTTNRTRTGGLLVANEYYAHMLPTNVDSFADGSKPTATIIEARQVDAAGAYDRDPYLRYAFTARDWHCGTMGWRRDAGRTGAWSVEDRPLRRFANNYERALLHETADRVEASHTLYRAGGATVMTFPDLLSFYPLRHLHSSLSLTTKIVNVASPYLQHDLLYIDDRFPDLDDCDSIGIPGTGGLGTDYNLDEGDTFFFDTECLPRRPWMPGGPYRDGWAPNRPQLLVGYWGRDADGGDRDPLFPVPGYWVPNPEEDPPEGEEYVHVPHITEASETDDNLVRPGFTPDFTDGLFLGSPRGAEFYELQARAFLGDIGFSFDALYVDNRTGGFITQVLWSGNGGRISETYIGNRTGVVPFRPIFDAWLALGGGAPAEGTKIAIERPPTSIGGPAPGAINPQVVSLL